MRRVKNIVQRNSGDARLCIYNGVKLPQDSKSTFPIQIQKDKSAINIGFIGGGSERKRLDVFLAGLCLAHKSNPNINGIILGPSNEEYNKAVNSVFNDGEDWPSIEALPFQEDIIPVLKKLDILCLTSDVEAFGRVLIEASHFNIPLIASDAAGPSEIVNITGLLLNVEVLLNWRKKC